MGRQQHLERLALGRSALQPGLEVDNQHRTDEPQAISTGVLDSATISAQQYDSKGRPVNSATDVQNASLRHASNEVLALVGVVERKDSADARLHLDTSLRRAAREHLLTREDNRGNEWSALIDVLSWFALWWPTALVRRIQVGLYSSDLPFLKILQCEARMMLGNGWRGILLGLLPGTGIAILHKVVWQLFALIAEESIGALQNQVVASTMKPRKARRLIRSLTIFVDVLLVAIDMLLLPLETYALARQLNIAPPTPIRPLLTAHLPSFFRAAYTTNFSNPASFLTSAAPYLIAYSFLTRDPSPDAPAFSDLTSYRLPSISEHDLSISPTQYPRPARYDPFAHILHNTWLLRQRFMAFVGWNVHEQERPGATYGWETDAHYVVPDDPFDGRVVAHRSTSLARLPATWLALRLDMFLVRILLLPVEGMVMRKVVEFYISSGLQVSEAARGVGVGQVMPSVWSSLAGRAGSKSLGAIARRTSQVGLSMALNLGVEAVFFGCVYALVRRQGISVFGWGKHHGSDVDDDDDEGERTLEANIVDGETIAVSC